MISKSNFAAIALLAAFGIASPALAQSSHRQPTGGYAAWESDQPPTRGYAAWESDQAPTRRHAAWQSDRQPTATYTSWESDGSPFTDGTSAPRGGNGTVRGVRHQQGAAVRSGLNAFALVPGGNAGRNPDSPELTGGGSIGYNQNIYNW